MHEYIDRESGMYESCPHITQQRPEYRGPIITCDDILPDGTCARGLIMPKWVFELDSSECECCIQDRLSRLSPQQMEAKRNRDTPYEHTQMRCPDFRGREQVKDGCDIWAERG